MNDEYSKLVDIAFKMHTDGNLEDAKSVYLKLLSLNPDDLNVQNLFAQVCFTLKDYDNALKYFKLVYDKTHLEEILINIAKVYYSIGNYKKVVEIFASLKKISNSCLKLFAVSYIKLSDFKSAIKIYNELISSNSMIKDDYLNLLYAYKSVGDIHNALKTALIAEKYIPDDVGLLYNTALLYKKLNDNDKALEYFTKVTDIEPDNKYAVLNIAVIYQVLNKKVSARILDGLLNKYPDDKLILSNIFMVYYNTSNYEDASKIAEKLIALYPDDIEYYSLLGQALLHAYNYNEAENAYKTAMEKNRDNMENIIQYSYILTCLGKDKEAEEIYEKYKNNPLFKEDYMFYRLKQKNFSEVKEDFYEYIYSNKEKKDDVILNVFYKYNLDKKYSIDEDKFLSYKNKVKKSPQAIFKEKLWKNQDISGKKLLVVSNCGAGDLLMFCRYIPEIMKLAGEVILQVPDSCLDLFKYNFSSLKVYSDKEQLNKNLYDYCASFFGLIYNINIDLKNIQTPNFYLKIDEQSVKEKASSVQTTGKKIGIYWQGNPAILQNRAMKLHHFEELFKLKNTQIYSFQISKIDSESENEKKYYPIIDLAPYIKNYSDTAALLMNMDLLVTIDTSIAHLAGALGVKTYLLLPYVAEWRWFNDTVTTPWYNSVRIFKQIRPDDWTEVIKRVKNECTL